LNGTADRGGSGRGDRTVAAQVKLAPQRNDMMPVSEQWA